MIILSGALVVLAIALLIAGILFGNAGTEVVGLDGLTMIYVSITVSIVSALCLAVGVYLRRRELFGKVDPGPTGTAKASKKGSKKARKGGKGAAGADPAAAEMTAEDAFTLPVPAVDVPADALVHVVRGRKRYHLDSCRQLAGRDKEELTYAEAQEEGFSPCTACMPDTALAARAAGSDAGSQQAVASGAVGTSAGGSGKAGSAATEARGDWAARRAGGMGRELFPSRPAQAEPTGTASGEDPMPAGREPATEWSAPTADQTGQTGQADRPAEEPATNWADDKTEQPDRTWQAERTAEPAPSADSTATARFTPVAAEPDAEPGREDAATAAEDDDWKAMAKAAAEDAAAEEAKATEPPAASGAAASKGDGLEVRILSGTKRYHRAECALIEDIGDDADDLEALSRAEAKARGCTPCLVCQPDLEHSRD